MEDNLFALHRVLLSRSYIHDPYVAFYVRDPKLRHIHKASVRDRVLHQAVFRVLCQIFERQFIHDSYASRIGKGTHRGVQRLETFARKQSMNFRRPLWALKCDVRKFFDTVDQNILLDIIRKTISDPDMFRLITAIVRSFETAPAKGLPLGNVTSQLFSNIYLNELDQFVKRVLKGRYYVRYCDDFVVLSGDGESLSFIKERIDQFLRERLRLALHKDKVSIRKLRQGVDFLGYVALPHFRVLRGKTKRRILRKITGIEAIAGQKNFEENSFTQSLHSYLGVLKHCRAFGLRSRILDLLH